MGFEPTTLGTTILYSNRLSYIHHLRLVSKSVCKCTNFFLFSKIFCKYFCENDKNYGDKSEDKPFLVYL